MVATHMGVLLPYSMNVKKKVKERWNDRSLHDASLQANPGSVLQDACQVESWMIKKTKNQKLCKVQLL